jgi:hypothetical protein
MVGRQHVSAVRTNASAAAAQAGTTADLDRIEAALGSARAPGPVAAPGAVAAPGCAEFLAALVLLRQLRERLACWEPELIDAARAHGASWAELAPALGVASRQAAERRALRLRPSHDEGAVTGDQRVAAERDRRAETRAIDAWAREQGADLRVLAAQISALMDLPEDAAPQVAALHAALGGPDAARLLQPLIDARAHLGPGHQGLADRIDKVSGGADSVRAASRARRSR